MNDDAAEKGMAPTAFGITPEELVHIVEHRDAVKLVALGGPQALANHLRTSLAAGLTHDQTSPDGDNPLLRQRKSTFGINSFTYPAPKGLLRLALDALMDPIIIALCVAAIVSVIIGVALPARRENLGYLEGVAIVLVILIVVLVQAVIDRQKELKFRQLNSIKDNFAVQTLRAGHWISVDSDDLVVGDVIKVCAGDKLAADAILFHSSKLKTNESAMTGEPVDIIKDIQSDPFLLSGTSVSEGLGHAIVVAVGTRSQWGIILAGLTVETEQTPLQKRLQRFALTIGYFGIFFASMTFLVSMIRWIVRAVHAAHTHTSSRPGQIIDYIVDAITIIVVAIPEGLPLAVTLGLAFAMKKMMNDNNLVRRLEACETMGSATQLNADKTGTLTMNRMTVVEAWWDGVLVQYQVPAGDSIGQNLTPGLEPGLTNQFRERVAIGVSVNSQASLALRPDGQTDFIGSKTECALLQLVGEWKMSYEDWRVQYPSTRVYLFSSDRKCMSTTALLQDGGTRMFTKGAPEVLLKSCVTRLASDGQTKIPLDEAQRAQVMQVVNEMAGRGLRTLLIADRDFSADIRDDSVWDEPPESQLNLIGIVGIKDPIRPETRAAVLQLRRAGVVVRMVTGDNPLTATYIAKEAGILEDDGLVMTGPEFRKMSVAEMDAKVLDLRVLARSTPMDKLVLVRRLKALGEVVSVTGDGTNDALALKEAHVGFALGVAGTEVAKEACDIVILDDNIQSMVQAVLWGRNVYESIRKFLQFQLVVNVTAVLLDFIAACAGVDLPLGPVPLLWVNMIMDSMGALALATEPPRPGLMDLKPMGLRAPLVNRAMYRNIIGGAIYQLTVCLTLQFAGKEIFGQGMSPLDLNTIIFNVFVFMQVFSEINSRRIEGRDVLGGIFRSTIFLVILVVTVGIQLVIVLAIGGTRVGASLGIGRVSGGGWIASLLCGVLVLPWGYLVRWWPLEWTVGRNDDDPPPPPVPEAVLSGAEGDWGRRNKRHQPWSLLGGVFGVGAAGGRRRRLRRRREGTSCKSDGAVDGGVAGVDELMPGMEEVGMSNGHGVHRDDESVPRKRSSHPANLGGGGGGGGGFANVVDSERNVEDGYDISPAKHQLRVFVHAVAFINTISKNGGVSEGGVSVFEEGRAGLSRKGSASSGSASWTGIKRNLSRSNGGGMMR